MPKPLLGLVLVPLCLLQGSSAPLPQPPVQGHVVLVIEGDALSLRITAAVPKTDPWGGVPRGLQSPWSIVVTAADGSILGSYPLDLSHFDLDPANVGNGPQVQGCRVVDTRVTALANIPRFRDTAALAILRDGRVVGTVTPAAYAELLEEGRKR